MPARPTTGPATAGHSRGRGLGYRRIREHEPFADNFEGGQRYRCDTLTEGGEDLVGPADAPLRVMAQGHPQRWASGLAGRHLKRDDEGPQIVANRRVALAALAGELAGREHDLGGVSEAGGVHVCSELNQVDRCGDPAGQRRLAEPDVVEVHERPGIGDAAGKGLTHAPLWKALHEPDVDQLGLTRDGRREGRRDCEPRFLAGRIEPGDRKTARGERRLPACQLVAPARVAFKGCSTQGQPPALDGLSPARSPGGGGSFGGFGSLVHAC